MKVSDIVEKLGGTAKTAEIFGVGPSAVSNWKAAERFPARLHYRIAKELRARRIKADERLFEVAA